jgi:uncharacterized protein YjbJ (UPF0337 family)
MPLREGLHGRMNRKFPWCGNAAQRPRSVSSINPKDTMKSGLRDQAEGSVKEAKGKAKQKYAKAVGAPDKNVEGAVDKLSGRLQKKTGQLKRDTMRE